MTTSRVAAVVAGVLVLGIGIASAEDAPDDPAGGETTTTVEDGTTTTTGDEETTTTAVESTTTTLDEDESTESTESSESSELEGENHGAIVSEAAQDHSNDERCGNHGQWVRSVATGAEDCVVPPGLQEREVEDDASGSVQDLPGPGRGNGNAGGNGNGRGPGGR